MEPVRDWEALPRGSRVLCALSGGADSVCLLHWLARQEDLTVCAGRCVSGGISPSLWVGET